MNSSRRNSVIFGCLFSLVVILVLLFENVSISSMGQKLAKNIIRPLWEINDENDEVASAHGLIQDNRLSKNELSQFRENIGQNNTVNSTKFIFISSYMRSGSTFLGRVLGFRSDVFYYYEPLQKLWGLQYTKGAKLCDIAKPSCEYSNDSLSTSLGFVSDVFNCRLQNHSGKINQGLVKVYSGPKWNSFHTCVANQRQVKECLINAEEQCLSHKYRMVKVLRMSLEDVALLLPKHPNLVIVHLFRDPRGTFNSHVKTSFYPVKMGEIDAIVNDTKAICERIREDIVMARKLKRKFPDRVKLVQYEDIYDNVEKAKILYKLLGMDLLQESEEHLSRQFRVKKEKTNKTSNLSGRFKYRKSLPFEYTKNIEDECKEVIRMLGFKLYKTEAKLRDEDFNPIDGKLPYELQ